MPLSKEMVDAALADSFPAGDPPCWTLGRDRYQESEPSDANIETDRKLNIGLSDEQRAAVVKSSMHCSRMSTFFTPKNRIARQLRIDLEGAEKQDGMGKRWRGC